MTQADWIGQVLHFWFEELTPQDWYSGRPELDAQIRDRFGPLHREIAAEVPPAAFEDARAALAAVIVLDQFSRNLHRGAGKAFAADNQALAVARNALDKDFGAAMTDPERQFLYMPFMHSEVLADQERCVSLFKALGDGTLAGYAEEHRDIVARFGRFPHRNGALDREPTEAEQKLLAGHRGFGQ